MLSKYCDTRKIVDLSLSMALGSLLKIDCSLLAVKADYSSHLTGILWSCCETAVFLPHLLLKVECTLSAGSLRITHLIWCSGLALVRRAEFNVLYIICDV